MSDSKKLSGAAFKRKRLEKEAAENKALKKCVKITSFFEGSSTSSATYKTASSDASSGLVPPQNTALGLIYTPNEKSDQHDLPVPVNTDSISNPAIEQLDANFDGNTADIIFSSDRANFPDVLTSEQKRLIIKLGPCQPVGSFAKDTTGRNKNRGFSANFYTGKGPMKIKRQWLCYSMTKNICYCQPCWLFDHSNSDPKFVKGTADWAHLVRDIESHEESKQHGISCEIYYRWQTGSTVDAIDQRAIENAANYWRKVLRRIIDVTITLATNNLPFRSHRVTSPQDNLNSQGNFLEVIHLLSRYDEVLTDLLARPKGTVNYLSPDIQNEVINLIAKQINVGIKKELEEAAFATIILDTTQDIAKIDQLSTVFRYVSIQKDENDRPRKLEVKETFCGFTQISDQTAGGLEAIVLQIIEEFTSISKLRGQAYDGAANMSGIYSGLQARIKKRNSAAEFVHCCSHNLNLVINDSVSNIQEVREFYEQLQNIYVFFSSVRRWAMLMDSNQTNLVKTLKKVCPTRWSSRIQALDALRSRYFDIIKLLTYLSLNGKNSEEKREARSLIKYFERFPTVILIVVQTKILEPINSVSKLLQGTDEDIEKSVEMLSSLIIQFTNMRNDWDSVKADAIELSNTWKIEPTFPEKRVRRIRRFFDELQEDECISNKEKRFKVEVFYRMLDVTTTQLDTRFQSVRRLSATFKCLSPTFLLQSPDGTILTASDVLSSTYPTDLSSNLGSQLLRFKSCFYSHLSKLTSIRGVAELLLIHSPASSSFTDIITACMIFLTLPVTTASCERSFSVLKLIKNYLRSSMSQHRLSSLATLSIERERARQLDLDKIIDQFAEAKARKKAF